MNNSVKQLKTSEEDKSIIVALIREEYRDATSFEEINNITESIFGVSLEPRDLNEFISCDFELESRRHEYKHHY